ncbi:hypothetical protein BH09PSE5_BH09PSE5_22280 [soil metagenome]
MNRINDVADALVHARKSSQPIDCMPFVDALTSTAEAYQVQRMVAESCEWFSDGETEYWKSGGRFRSGPMGHARLPRQGVLQSGSAAPPSAYGTRLGEAEIALRLNRTVDADTAAGLDLEGSRKLIDSMCAAIELCTSRWLQKSAAPDLLRLADLQSHDSLVLGDWVPFDAERAWTEQPCRFSMGSRPPVLRQGSHHLGDPSWPLVEWLRHATARGHVVPAGSVVITGNWVGEQPVERGELVNAAFEGIGEVEVRT